MSNGQELATAGMIGGAAQAPSLTERLIREREQLTARLEEINSILDQLDTQPELQAILDALAKLGQRIY